MRKIFGLAAIALSLLALAPTSSAATDSAIVVSACGTPPVTYTAGHPFSITQDTTGTLCTAGGGGGGGNVTVVGPLGSRASAGAVSVVIANDQSAIAVGNAQGSTTSGQSGPLIQGAVTTSAPTYTNAQTSPLSLDTSGNLRVNVVAGGGTGGTSSNFAAAFPGTGTAIGAKNGANMVNLTADGSNNLNVNCAVGCAGGTFNNNADGVATSATNGQAAAWMYGFNGTTWDRLEVDGSKNLKVVLASGSNVIGHVIVDSGTITTVSTVSAVTAITNALPAGTNVIGHVIVDSGTITTVSAVTAITNALPAGTNVIGHVIVDSAAGVAQGSTTSGQTVSPIGCRTLTSAPSDTTAQTNMPWCRVNGTLAQDLASINGTTILTGGVNGSQGIGGLAATNATPSGNPVAISGTAETAEPTLATNGQNATLATDLAHKLIVSPYANPENFVSGTTSAMTGTTSTSLIAAPASGLRNYITQITCVNSHATVGTFVTVQDGSGGTALYTLAAASVFGGTAITFPTPLRQPTTATAIFVANVTTGANVICSASGYKGQ